MRPPLNFLLTVATLVRAPLASGTGGIEAPGVEQRPLAVEMHQANFGDAKNGGGPIRLTRLRVDLAHTELVIKTAPTGASLTALVETGAIAAINGGYFDRAFAPIGWVRDARREYHPKNRMQRGGVLAIHDGLAYIGTAENLPFKPDFALWSFPLLVRHPGASGMRGDDGRRAARTVACLTSAVEAGTASTLDFFIIPAGLLSGPTLAEAAAVLRAPASRGGFGCTAALNLDGGPSTGAWFQDDRPGEPSPYVSLNRAPIGYAISFLKK